MVAPLIAARFLGAGLLSVTEAGAARATLAGRLAGSELARAVFRDSEDATDEHEDMFVPVSSTAIRAIGWRKDGIIIVDFVRGGTYTYDGSYQTFQAFLSAPSKGQFFNQFFR
jgi:KTSC domain